MLSGSLRRYKSFALRKQISPIFPIAVEPLLEFVEELKQSNKNHSLRVVCNGLRHYPSHDEKWFKEVFQHPKVLKSLGIESRTRMRFAVAAHDRKVVKATKVANKAMHKALPKDYNNWLNEIVEPTKNNSSTEKNPKKAIQRKKSEPKLYISIPKEL
ncbi:unnamed protein product [Cunninghamella blakesleeana]